MQVRSLAYRTELFFPQFEGIVRDRGNYLVVETPNNPGFFWGNFLLFERAPISGSLNLWTEIFKREFAHNSLVQHLTFAWDGVDGFPGDPSEFLANGFALEESTVMTAKSLPAIDPQKNLLIRPLSSAADWEAALENQILCRAAGFDPLPYREFKTIQMNRYRKMSAAGKGHWFGAFFENQLVGDLGIFVGEGLARYQNVGVHPSFRKRGISKILLSESARFMKEHFLLEKLIIVADPNDFPAKIYSSVGFREEERCAGIYWWKR